MKNNMKTDIGMKRSIPKHKLAHPFWDHVHAVPTMKDLLWESASTVSV
jgi:hypothetical protein